MIRRLLTFPAVFIGVAWAQWRSAAREARLRAELGENYEGEAAP